MSNTSVLTSEVGLTQPTNLPGSLAQSVSAAAYAWRVAEEFRLLQLPYEHPDVATWKQRPSGSTPRSTEGLTVRDS